MKNRDKDNLHSLVKLEIALGHDMNVAVKAIGKFGFKAATIRKYYKALKPTE